MAVDYRIRGSRRSGVSFWLWQRITAIFIVVGLAILVGALISVGSYDYSSWRHMVTATGMRWLLGGWLMAVVIHAYIGMETILRDYIHHGALLLVSKVVVGTVLLWLLAESLMVCTTWR